MRVGLSKKAAGGFTAPSRSPASASSSSSSGKKEISVPVVAPPREAAAPKKRALPEEDEAPQDSQVLSARKKEKRDSLAPSAVGEPWECGACGGNNVEFQEACEFCDAVRKKVVFEVAAKVLRKQQQQQSSEAESLRREDSLPSPTRARVTEALAGVKVRKG